MLIYKYNRMIINKGGKISMKKSFKLKALVLSMLVMMGLTLVPSLYAVEPFKNHDGVTEENAEIGRAHV